MTKVTGFEMVAGEGLKLAADAHGNNVAFRCLHCSWPVLAVFLEGHRGSSANTPTNCQGCGARYWVEVDSSQSRLRLHGLPS